MSQDKYDRQTRLWGEGQILIVNSRLACLGSDALSCEILKNLVLSGVGFVSVIDNHVVNQQDLDTNFFLSRDDLGKQRGQLVLKNLLELNPDVEGEYVESSASELLNTTFEYLKTFDLVVSCNRTEV